jgi:hypothetical protein
MNIVLLATNKEERFHDKSKITSDSNEVIWQLVDFMAVKSKVNTMLTCLIKQKL